MRKESFRVVAAPDVDNKIERDLSLAKVRAGKASLGCFLHFTEQGSSFSLAVLTYSIHLFSSFLKNAFCGTET